MDRLRSPLVDRRRFDSAAVEDPKVRFTSHFARIWRVVLFVTLALDAREGLLRVKRSLEARRGLSPAPTPRMTCWDSFVQRTSSLLFWPVFVAYLIGGISLAYALVNFFSNLQAFNPTLHEVLLADVWLGALAGVVSLTFIYVYYGGSGAKGMRDLALLEALYWKIKACPRDLSVLPGNQTGPASTTDNMFDRLRAHSQSAAGDVAGDSDGVEHAMSQNMVLQVDDDAIARAVALAESDRRITLRWTIAEVSLVVLGLLYLLVRLVDDAITIKPLWEKAMQGRVPFWVYCLSSLFFQGTNAVAVVFHGLHCLALASVLDLLARRIRGGAVPVVKYMQLALDYMHLLRNHNRLWGRAITLTLMFYTFEGIVTLFESVVFEQVGSTNPLLLLVTVLDYVVVLPLLLIPPALIRHYAHKMLDCNNICRLLLISYAQRTRDAILDGEDVTASTPLLSAKQSSWEQPFRWHSSLAAITVRKNRTSSIGNQGGALGSAGRQAAAAAAAAASAGRRKPAASTWVHPARSQADAEEGSAAAWQSRQAGPDTRGTASVARLSPSTALSDASTNRSFSSLPRIAGSLRSGYAAPSLPRSTASTPQHGAAGTANSDDRSGASAAPPISGRGRSQSSLSQEEEERRARAAEAAYSAMWQEIGAIDSFAIMIQTSRVYARVLNVPMTADLIGKFYSLIFSGAYVSSRLVRTN